VDLAYEEFCLRAESGEALNQRQFCAKFSQLQHSLARMLNLHDVLQNTSLGQNLPGNEQVEWPEIGERWLDWTLIEEIGRGAFSRVFLAEEPSLGNRRVVVKCATSGAGEAFLLGKLAHAAVMPIHSIRHDEPRQLVGICMPYVGRVTLADVLNRLIDPSTQQISPAIFAPQLDEWRAGVSDKRATPTGPAYAVYVARLIEKVARGLALAHGEKVLHGDIKPSNVILSFAGEPLLVDFNLSDDGSAETRKLGGTPPYMAPERLALLSPGGAAQFDRTQVELNLRSDVFSLGVVLYELLYGDAPYDFVVEDLTAEYRVKNSALFPARSAAGEALPRELTEVVARAIALDPHERCPSVVELADALGRFADKYEPQPKVNRSGWPVRLAIALLVAAGIIPFLAGSLWNEPGEDRGPSPVPTAPLEIAPEESAERKILRTAIEYLERPDFVLAAAQLQNLPKQFRGREVQAWLGFSLAQEGMYPSAKYRFEQALPELDDTGILWHNIGCCESADGQHHRALQCFTLAVNCNPYQAKSYQQLAATKFSIALRDRSPPAPGAYDDLEAALSLSAEKPDLLFDAARLYAYGMRWDQAQFAAPCHKYTRRALELGVPPERFKSVFVDDAELEPWIPAVLPKPVPPPGRATTFLPPPYDLRDVLQQLP
jgi:serine/threonine protein kinase